MLGTQWVTGDGVDTRVSYAVLANSSRRAPIAQSAEAADLKSVQCRFESDWGHSAIRVLRQSHFCEPLCHRDGGLPGVVDNHAQLCIAGKQRHHQVPYRWVLDFRKRHVFVGGA